MYILTQPFLFPSAREISNSILEKTGKKLLVKREEKNTPPSIRWGNSHSLGQANDTMLNSAGLIRLCSNKRLFSREMLGKVAHVEYHMHTVPEHFPVVIRTVANGMRGEGIVICTSKEEFEQNYLNSLWAYFYKFTFELGVHLLGGEVVKVFKKIREEGELEEEFPIRNSHRGYSFSLKNVETYPKLLEVVDSFYATMPIQMTRLDVGWDSINKTYRVIEANTAPSVSENSNTLDLYTDFIVERLGL